jgi:hypothetical protein
MPRPRTRVTCPICNAETVPSRAHQPCQCGCGLCSQRNFVNAGHSFVHRTLLLEAYNGDFTACVRLVAMGLATSPQSAQQTAFDLLERYGWLEQQGYGNYRVGDVTDPNRSANRQTRRLVQRTRNVRHADPVGYNPDSLAGVRTARPNLNTLAPAGTVNVPTPAYVPPIPAYVPQPSVSAATVAHSYMDGLLWPYADDNPDTFGVEMEYESSAEHSDQYVVARCISDALVQVNAEYGTRYYAKVESYNHNDSDPNKVKITTDATVHGGEIVSPKLSGTLGFKVLKAICDGCTAANVDVMLRRRNYAGEVTTVTSAAGLHVHVNGRMLTRRQLARLAHIYTDATPVIRSIMPQRRQNEYYCQDLCDEELERIDRGDINYIDRYRTVNVRNYVDTNATEHRPRGTVEFRQHNGTIEYQAIANWVRLLFPDDHPFGGRFRFGFGLDLRDHNRDKRSGCSCPGLWAFKIQWHGLDF